MEVGSSVLSTEPVELERELIGSKVVERQKLELLFFGKRKFHWVTAKRRASVGNALTADERECPAGVRITRPDQEI